MKNLFAAEPRIAAASAISLDFKVGRQVGPVPVETRAEPVPRDAADNIARLIIIGLFSFMAVRIGANFLETGRFTGLLLLASEALVVVLTVFRRAPAIVDRSMRARLLTTLAMIGPPLVRPAALTPIVPDAVTVAISAVG
jgi:hypothetical protein